MSEWLLKPRGNRHVEPQSLGRRGRDPKGPDPPSVGAVGISSAEESHEEKHIGRLATGRRVPDQRSAALSRGVGGRLTWPVGAKSAFLRTNGRRQHNLAWIGGPDPLLWEVGEGFHTRRRERR